MGTAREAMLYERLDGEHVICNLCAHRCRIAEGRRGVCQVRENREGILYTLVYGRAIAQHVDPVEKKPLYHVFPGSTAYSIATPGCNFCCAWCQNADISQMPRTSNVIAGRETKPKEIVAAAQRAGCRSVAYTYTEPTIFFEYAYDTSLLAKEAGLANILVTNGYMTDAMLEKAASVIDAANVDLKGFRDDFYREYVGARLQPVLDSLTMMRDVGIWIEVTTLIIPGLNDSAGELREAAQFIAQELGPDTPWHLSRFFPAFEMRNIGPTPVATLRQAEQIGREVGLRHIYVGNVAGENNTRCHACGALLIRRSGYTRPENRVDAQGCCPDCGEPLAGLGMSPAD